MRAAVMSALTPGIANTGSVDSLGNACPGNLKFQPSEAAARQVEIIIQRIRNGEPLSHLIPSPIRARPARRLPLVIYSDFEPDDLMAIAQLWQWRARQPGLDTEGARPVVVMVANFQQKDGGTVFEKKLLMARLMLGLEAYVDFQILTAPSLEFKENKTVHPLGRACYQQHQRAVATAAQEIASLANEPRVDFYVLAPGHGHLGTLIQQLELEHAPAMAQLRTRCRVVAYTGSFNTRGTCREDFEALCQLVSDAPLIDISRFIFFGGAGAHPVSESADTFSSPTLASHLSSRSPLLVAVIQSFNEEFNGYLIFPENHRLFCCGKVVDTRSQEEKERFDKDIAPLFKRDGVSAYCRALVADGALWSKVAGFKRSTVRAFAKGTVDMPLCDQVCFIFEWLQKFKASALSMGPTGKWWVDPQTGYSGVADPDHPHALGIPALQPRLAEPQNEEVLLAVRSALEEHLLRHLDESVMPVRSSMVVNCCSRTCSTCWPRRRAFSEEPSPTGSWQLARDGNWRRFSGRAGMPLPTGDWQPTESGWHRVAGTLSSPRDSSANIPSTGTGVAPFTWNSATATVTTTTTTNSKDSRSTTGHHLAPNNGGATPLGRFRSTP